MLFWLTIIIVGVLTYALRVSFIAFYGKITIPPTVQRALSFVPVTVLPAIIAQQLLVRDGAWFVSAHNPRLLAGVVAVVVAWRTRNVLLTIAIGMLSLWLFQAAL
jgi:branched-subunit amino acid transport protein